MIRGPPTISATKRPRWINLHFDMVSPRRLHAGGALYAYPISGTAVIPVDV